jgi:hypothetical protein
MAKNLAVLFVFGLFAFAGAVLFKGGQVEFMAAMANGEVLPMLSALAWAHKIEIAVAAITIVFLAFGWAAAGTKTEVRSTKRNR